MATHKQLAALRKGRAKLRKMQRARKRRKKKGKKC